MDEKYKKLIKNIEAKDRIIIQLRREIIELKEENKIVLIDNEFKDIDKKNILKYQILLTKQKREIKELNEQLKKVSFEKEQMSKILDKDGIEIVGGEVLNNKKEYNEENLKYENVRLKEELENRLQGISNYIKEQNIIIKSIIDGENYYFKKQNLNLLKDNKNLKSKLEKYEKDLNLFKQKNENIFIRENIDLKSKLDDYESKIKLMQIKYEEKFRENRSLNSSIKNYAEEVNLLIIKNENLENEIKQLKEEKEDLKNKNENLLEQNDKLRNYEILKNENEELKNEKEKLKNKYDILKKDYNVLKNGNIKEENYSNENLINNININTSFKTGKEYYNNLLMKENKGDKGNKKFKEENKKLNNSQYNYFK